MAGRGCTIVVKLLGGSTGDGEVEELSLPVALHSPLQVLKEQLASIVGIPVAAQVLILCNLSDPDRNSDVLLTGREGSTLRSCGIRNGSTLTLHALGISNERKMKLANEAWAKKGAQAESEEHRITLSTEITAAEANHSYNGVIFDVQSHGPYEVLVHSVSIAGMLGRVRIYARDRPWEENLPERRSEARWWAERETIARDGWECVADRTCWPSWDKPVEIVFDKPVKILPHQIRALYCHSGLPDDLGIQYQSYQKHDVVAEDEHIVILPGLGHTGAEPFDETAGWYRAYRALAGSVTYTVKRKGWTPFEHKIFPEPLKQAVKTVLMCQNQDHYLRSRSASDAGTGTPHLSRQPSSGSTVTSPTAATAPGFMRMDRGLSSSSGASVEKGEQDEEDGEPVQKMSADDPLYVPPSGLQSLAAAAEGSSSSNARESRERDARAQDIAAEVMQRLREACRGRRISELPVFVIYHILEYLHWDWFEESYDGESLGASTSPTSAQVRRAGKALGSGREGANAQGARGLLFRLVQQMGGSLNASSVPGLQGLLNYHYMGGAVQGSGHYHDDEDSEEEDDDSDYMDEMDFDDDEDDGDDYEEEDEDEEDDDEGEEGEGEEVGEEERQESLGRIASLADMSAEDLKASMEEEDSTAMEDQLGEDISDSDVDANNSF